MPRSGGPTWTTWRPVIISRDSSTALPRSTFLVVYLANPSVARCRRLRSYCPASTLRCRRSDSTHASPVTTECDGDSQSAGQICPSVPVNLRPGDSGCEHPGHQRNATPRPTPGPTQATRRLDDSIAPSPEPAQTAQPAALLPWPSRLAISRIASASAPARTGSAAR